MSTDLRGCSAWIHIDPYLHSLTASRVPQIDVPKSWELSTLSCSSPPASSRNRQQANAIFTVLAPLATSSRPYPRSLPVASEPSSKSIPSELSTQSRQQFPTWLKARPEIPTHHLRGIWEQEVGSLQYQQLSTIRGFPCSLMSAQPRLVSTVS